MTVCSLHDASQPSARIQPVATRSCQSVWWQCCSAQRECWLTGTSRLSELEYLPPSSQNLAIRSYPVTAKSSSHLHVPSEIHFNIMPRPVRLFKMVYFYEIFQPKCCIDSLSYDITFCWEVASFLCSTELLLWTGTIRHAFFESYSTMYALYKGIQLRCSNI